MVVVVVINTTSTWQHGGQVLAARVKAKADGTKTVIVTIHHPIVVAIHPIAVIVIAIAVITVVAVVYRVI